MASLQEAKEDVKGRENEVKYKWMEGNGKKDEEEDDMVWTEFQIAVK